MNITYILQKELSFRYMFLSRLFSDCKYYLGPAGRSSSVLWAGEVSLHLEYMEAILNSFTPSERPKWLTVAVFENLKNRMLWKNIY